MFTGWSGKGLGVEEQGRIDPVEPAAVRGRSQKFSGLGNAVSDRYSVLCTPRGSACSVNPSAKYKQQEVIHVQEVNTQGKLLVKTKIVRKSSS